jgi:hypothetical protein
MNTKVVITKVGQDTAPPQVVPSSTGKKKTLKTYPRGILKTAKNRIVLKAVSDPAKSSPLKKFMRKHTIRLLTEKGVRHHRKTIRKQIAKMSDENVKKLVQKAGLLKNPNTPTPIMREMLSSGMIAGFISAE